MSKPTETDPLAGLLKSLRGTQTMYADHDAAATDADREFYASRDEKYRLRIAALEALIAERDRLREMVSMIEDGSLFFDDDDDCGEEQMWFGESKDGGHTGFKTIDQAYDHIVAARKEAP